ncbi:MAG: chemotaxis protein CheX [Magnetococcales bacterium]|nr:chemotaxis protein CheX [Magnetococcales bacterium]
MSENENNKKLDISQRLLECMQLSVMDTLSTMALLDTTPLDTKTSDIFNCSIQIGGLIHLYGKHEGMIAVLGERSIMIEIISKIICLPIEEMVDDDIFDGMCEIVNMIAGGMKSKAGLKTNAKLAPPIAIIGSKCQAHWKTSRPTYITTFQTEIGNFQVHTSV